MAISATSLISSTINQALPQVFPTTLRTLISEYVFDFPVKDGYGEFVVYDTLKIEITKETFLKCYAIFNRFSSQILEKPLKDRYEKIRKEIQQIDPLFEICFIPHGLVELSLMHQVVEEEMNNIDDSLPQCRKFQLPKDLQSNHLCWHGISCDNDEEVTNDNPDIQEIAYRLNKVLIKKIGIVQPALTYRKIMYLARREIKYLKDVSQEIQTKKYKRMAKIVSSIIGPEDWRCTSYEIDDSSLILRAIGIECTAKNCKMLYRGGDFEKDATFYVEEDSSTRNTWSVSFSTGIFSGSVYDADISSARNWYGEKDGQKRDAYLLRFPIGSEYDKIFYTPKSNTICQFYYYGDASHPRTKIPKELSGRPIRGVMNQTNQTEEYIKRHCYTSLSSDKVESIFQRCKSECSVVLRRAKG